MLVLAMPVSLLSYPTSRVIWVVFFVIIVALSVNITWKIYSGPPDLRWIGWLLGFTFVPVLQALRVGQTGPLLLLGSAGFLYFMQKKKLIIAGGFLSLLFIKPHILYLLLFSVFFWSLYEKQIRSLHRGWYYFADRRVYIMGGKSGCYLTIFICSHKLPPSRLGNTDHRRHYALDSGNPTFLDSIYTNICWNCMAINLLVPTKKDLGLAPNCAIDHPGIRSDFRLMVGYSIKQYY